ncbi:MAG: hypothetical protein JKX78_14340 [Alteromonadaceae bacterium]|nr:hypothetical protein [Alteromonadaceae bacterium]
MDVKEVQLSHTLTNKDFRIDSQYHTQKLIKNAKLEYKKINDILVKAQYGISIAMNELAIGYPIYRMNEIHNMLCDQDVAKFVDITQDELKVFTLNDRDVIFNRTNSIEWVGRTGIYRKLDQRDFVFASYLVRFIPNEEFILPEYLTCFLNSKYGVLDLKRRARQSVNQANINPEEVKAIEIPMLPLNFQDRLKNIFDIAYEQGVNSKQLYQDAEGSLLNELGLLNYQPSTEHISVKSFSDSFGNSGRLDAEYYQPKYECYFEKITEYSKGYTLIKDEFIHNTLKSTKSKDGYFYIEIRDVNIEDGSSHPNYVETLDLPANAKIEACKSDLLISKVRPYRGAVCVIESDVDNLIVSGAFTVLRNKPDSVFSVEVLKVLLRTTVYKDWLLKFNVGTSYPVIKDIDVLNLPIPKIPEIMQADIVTKVKESQQLKAQSIHLLEVAKRAVEIVIEENEQVALEYITTETNSN